MTKEDNPRKISEIIEELGDVRGLFLDEGISIDAQPEKFQKALGTIWNIASVSCPSNGSIQFRVPAQKLVELGLVSNKAEERITAREKEEQLQEEDLKNIISIQPLKNKDGFQITETYMIKIEEEFDSRIRRDSIVMERLFLIKNNDGFIQVEAEKGETSYHLHVLGELWDPREKKVSMGYGEVETTPRRINTALALLIEGVAPGYIEKEN